VWNWGIFFVAPPLNFCWRAGKKKSGEYGEVGRMAGFEERGVKEGVTRASAKPQTRNFVSLPSHANT